MVGATLAELRAEGLLRPPADGGHIAVKEAVLPFNRFPDVDTVLGPEMRSTGEVMGIDRTFGLAFAKSQTAAGSRLPSAGTVFFSLADRDKPRGWSRPGGSPSSASRSWRPPAPPHASRPRGSRSTRSSASSPGDGERTDAGTSTRSSCWRRARSTWWSTRPAGRGPRADGAHIRRTATARGHPRASPRWRRRSRRPRGWATSPHRRPRRSLQEYHRDGQLRLEV